MTERDGTKLVPINERETMQETEVMDETPLERAYRLGEGCGGLDADGVKMLVEMSRENAALAPGEMFEDDDTAA